MRGGSNRLLSPEDLAEVLGVSRKTVYRNWQSWGLQGRRLGRQIRFSERDVQQFIERSAL